MNNCILHPPSNLNTLAAEVNQSAKMNHRKVKTSYNSCQVKEYWDDLAREEWIEACQNLYGEVGKEVVSFGPWEKALLEFFFLTPYAWPDKREFPSQMSREVGPILVSYMQEFPHMDCECKRRKEMVKQLEKRYHTNWIWSVGDCYYMYQCYYYRSYLHPPKMQLCIESIHFDEKERSRTAQREAKAVLAKFKFGQGFSLQSSCVMVIKGLLEKDFTHAVDTLPLPKELMNMIHPILPQRFTSARCPMYQLVASFARGEWLDNPLQFNNMLDLMK